MANGVPTDADDLHLSLWTMYELSYRGFDDVDDDLEWHPASSVRPTHHRR